MTCGIALTESVTSLGKCTKKLNNNDKVGFGQPCFLFAEKFFQLFFKNPLTRWLRCGIIVVQTETRKESEMSKKVKIHISLANEIYDKGKQRADELGIPFSTYLSVLIANDAKNTKERRK